jgi:uncharacterized protein (DUF1684 family)
LSLTLLDWRRQVFQLYAEVRQSRDGAAAHEHWRTTRNELLMHHPDSPVPIHQRVAYSGAVVAEYNPSLRFELEVDTDVPRERRDVATSTDGVIPFERMGRLDVPDLGRLDVWWLQSYGGGVFVPVKDTTSGSTTYGGGRYLLDTVKGADLGGDSRRLVIDFNFAYNPSCAYDPRWSCPLAPAGNVIDHPIVAGELTSSA